MNTSKYTSIPSKNLDVSLSLKPKFLFQDNEAIFQKKNTKILKLNNVTVYHSLWIHQYMHTDLHVNKMAAARLVKWSCIKSNPVL